MKMTTRIVSPLAALALTFGVVTLSAQMPAPGAAPQAQQQPEVLTAQGELLRVNPDQQLFWIQNADGNELQFRYDDQTEVTGGAENVEGLSTKTGTRVNVEYHAVDGNAVATKIAIQAAEAQPEQQEQPQQ